jgi:hypothetical protein
MPDWGFWTKSSRLAARRRLEGAGAETVLHYFSVPDFELLERLRLRNQRLPANTFVITPEMFDKFSELFEAPQNDEQPVVVDQSRLTTGCG